MSTSTTEEEYPATVLVSIETLYTRYTRPYLRKWRFCRDCLLQSEPDNVTNEVRDFRSCPFTHVEKSNRERKLAVNRRM